MVSSFVALDLKRVLTHVGVGMGAASFWRGAWYILDDHLFPDDPLLSAASSLGLGVVGMIGSQGLVAKCERLQQMALKGKLVAPNALRGLQVARFGALYTIAMSCVLVWRGTWVGWDVFYEYTHPHQTPCRTGVKSTDPGHLSTSGLLSHVLAVSALVGTGLFASVLAPPAATSVIRDWAVKTGANPYSYTGAKANSQLWQMFTSGATTTTSASSSKSTVSLQVRQFSSPRPLTLVRPQRHFSTHMHATVASSSSSSSLRSHSSSTLRSQLMLYQQQRRWL